MLKSIRSFISSGGLVFLLGLAILLTGYFVSCNLFWQVFLFCMFAIVVVVLQGHIAHGIALILYGYLALYPANLFFPEMKKVRVGETAERWHITSVTNALGHVLQANEVIKLQFSLSDVAADIGKYGGMSSKLHIYGINLDNLDVGMEGARNGDVIYEPFFSITRLVVGLDGSDSAMIKVMLRVRDPAKPLPEILQGAEYYKDMNNSLAVCVTCFNNKTRIFYHYTQISIDAL